MRPVAVAVVGVDVGKLLGARAVARHLRQRRRIHAAVYEINKHAFSKKVANHGPAVALHFMNYNFVRIHQTLRVTPAMAAGVTDRLWSVENIAAILDRLGRKTPNG